MNGGVEEKWVAEFGAVAGFFAGDRLEPRCTIAGSLFGHRRPAFVGIEFCYRRRLRGCVFTEVFLVDDAALAGDEGGDAGVPVGLRVGDEGEILRSSFR